MPDGESKTGSSPQTDFLVPPIVPFVGYSGSGKTTVLVEVIAELTRRGFRVGTIKHHSHDFEMDIPGKDTWRHKKAGASATIISSPKRFGMVRDVDQEMTLESLFPLLTGVDLIVVEGYKRVSRPKIEVFRSEISDTPACATDKYLVGLVSDTPIDLGVPRFSPHDVAAIVNFIVSHLDLFR